MKYFIFILVFFFANLSQSSSICKGVFKKPTPAQTKLEEACKANDLDTVTHLLRKNVDPNFLNEKGYSPLHYAAYNDNPYIIEALLKANASIDQKSQPSPKLYFGNLYGPSHIHIHKLNIKTISDLEKYSQGETPLHLAVLGNKAAAVQLLVSKGADINATNNFKETPLDWAESWPKAYQEGIIDFLIRNQAVSGRNIIK